MECQVKEDIFQKSISDTLELKAIASFVKTLNNIYKFFIIGIR